MTRQWRTILLLGFLIGLAGALGCATVGKDFPRDFAEKIVVGKTTRVEVERTLGQPFRTGLDSGDPTANYIYYRLGCFVDTITQDLTVRYSAQGVVKSYTFNSNTPVQEEKIDYNAR